MTDISKWNFATTFTAHQAAALILGLEPNESSESQIQPVLESMNDCYSIAVSHRLTVSNPGMKQAIPPPSRLESSEMLLIDSWMTSGVIESSNFLKWLESDESAFDQQTFTREQLTGWLKAISMPSKYVFMSGRGKAINAQEKPLAKRERDTLLTIIAVLCNDAKYDYTKHAKTAVLIEGTAARMGVSIGETTIEGHLKKVPDALATRMK